MRCHRVPEELAVPRAIHRILVPIDLQTQPLLQVPGDRLHHPFPGRLRLHVDVTVVGIPAEAVTPPFQLLVQIVQQDVGEQRRQRAALRGPFFPGLRDSLDHHPGGEIPPEQPKETLVSDPSCHPCHQHVMVHTVEELLQIHIHHKAIARFHVGLGRHDRVVAPSPRTEAVTALAEVGIEDGGYHLQDRLLNQPVQNRRDAQQACPLPVRLRDLYPSDRLGNVRLAEQLLPDARPVLLQVRRQGLDRHPVDPRRSPVGPDTLEGFHQVLTAQHLLKKTFRLRSGFFRSHRGRLTLPALPLAGSARYPPGVLWLLSHPDCVYFIRRGTRYPSGLPCSGLRRRAQRPLCPRLTSARSSRHLPAALASQERRTDLPGYCAPSFPPSTRRIYSRTFRMTIGLQIFRPPCPGAVASYALRIPRAGGLPTASFRPRLAAAALTVLLRVPVIGARGGPTLPRGCGFAGAPGKKARLPPGFSDIESCFS